MRSASVRSIRPSLYAVGSGFLLVLALASGACRSERDDACRILLADKVGSDSLPAGLFGRRTFYSRTLETCVLVEESRTGVDMRVDDLSDDFLSAMALFHCDRQGVDAAIIDSVRAHRGDMWSVTVDRWLHDGRGGLPRVLRAPVSPYSEPMCREALQAFLASIR